MYNRFEYIKRRTRELGTLLNLRCFVLLDNNGNSIMVKFQAYNETSCWKTTINTQFSDHVQDKSYINMHLKKASFSLVERKYDATS